MTGLSRDEQAAFAAAQADSVLSDAALAAFRDEWEPQLAALGLALDGLPLSPDEPDDILLDLESPPNYDGPPADWESVGVVAPAVLPDGVAEVDVLEFIASGTDEDDEEWLVNGLVPLHGLTILGGNPKSGKTLFALDLCLAVATRSAFFGRETSEAAFLFVTEEGTPGETRKRFRRLIASRGVPTLPGRIIHRRGVRFDDPRSWRQVRDALARLEQPTLLVLDPLRDMLEGDENDSKTISAVARAIHAILRDFDHVTVVLLHHLTKRGDGDGGQRLRGSSALWATADCTLILKTDPIPDDTAEAGDVELRGSVSVEPRNAQRGRFFWRWDPESGQFIESAAEARTLTDRAQAFIGANGPQTTNALAAALGTTPDVMRHSLNRDRSRFRNMPGAGPNEPSTWGLAE
jgi:hypothetical protein